MIPYIVFIVMTLVLSILYDGRDNSKQKRIWYAITCIYLIVLAGLRNGVGGDTLVYMEDYDDVGKYTHHYMFMKEYIMEHMLLKGHMPLWSIFLGACRFLFESFYVFQFIHAIIINIAFFYLFKKYCKHIFLCALVYGISGYFFLFNTEVLRESIALVCSLIAIEYYLHDNKTRFVAFWIIGLLFHISALIVIIFPLMRYIPIRRESLVWSLVIAFLLWFGSDYIIEHMPSYILNSDASISSKVIRYSDYKNNFFGFLSNCLQYICFPYFIMYYVLQMEGDDSYQTEKKQLIAFMLTIGVLSVGISGFARLRNYSAIYYVIALGDFLYLYFHSPKYLYIARTAVLAGVIFYFTHFYASYYPSSHRHHYEYYYPYTSICNSDDSYNFRYEMHEESTDAERELENTRSR